MLTGKNGVLNRANEAKYTNEVAQFEEKVKLAQISLQAEITAKTKSQPGYIATEENNFASLAGEVANDLDVTAIKAPATEETKINKEGYTVGYYLDNPGDSTTDGKGFITIWYTSNSFRATLDRDEIISKYGIIDIAESSNSRNQAALVAVITVENYSCTLSNTALTSTTDGDSDITKATYGATITGSNTNENGEIKGKIKIESITIPSTYEIGAGDIDSLSTTISPANATESVKWVLVDGSTYATLNERTGAITAGNTQGNGVLKVKATNQAGTIESNVCTISIGKSKYIDYSYVEYDVAYTDVYDSTATFDKNNGWRLITKDSELGGNAAVAGAEATYTGPIEIISTGIPAGLYYYHSYINTSTYADNYSWKGTDSDITKYLDEEKFYGSGSNRNHNMYAVTGLYYHFDLIKFEKEIGSAIYSGGKYGMGYYTNISKLGSAQNETITGDIFKARQDAKVRSVTLADITGSKDSGTTKDEHRTGLYTLNAYTPKPGKGYYWLASPIQGSDGNVRYVNSRGNISSNTNTYYGVRPVVSMSNVTIKREAGSHVWKIIN